MIMEQYVSSKTKTCNYAKVKTKIPKLPKTR